MSSTGKTSRTLQGAAGARTAALLALAFGTAGCAGPRVGRVVDARMPRLPETTVTGGRTAGPFYERVETSDGDVRTSFRPLLHTRIEAPRDAARIREVLWPLYADHRRGEHFSWRFLLFFGADFQADEPGSRYHAWLLPLWFQGRSASGEGYAALFPLGGVLRDFLTFDRLSFFGFPLWGRSEKNGVTGRHLFWPVFAWIEGEGLFRWRVFPLAGYGRREGHWERHFVLWPIWNHVRYLREPTAGTEWALFPVFGRAERGVESSWYVLPPFFQVTLGRGRNAGQRRVLAPWPLVRIEDSKDRHKRIVWPLYASTWSDRHRNTHVLWPLFRYTSSRSGGSLRRHWSLAPLFHRGVQLDIPAPAATGETPAEASRTVYTRLWPLFSSLDRDGREFLRVPDFSLQRRTGALERNLLQMATLYTRGGDAATARVEHDLLWGFLRWGRDRRGWRELRLWPFFAWSRGEDGDPGAFSLLGGCLRFPVSWGGGDGDGPRETP